MVNKPNSFLLTQKSISFPFCLHIFFVGKNVTNLVTRILELARIYKRKNGFVFPTSTTATVEVDGIIYRKTIYTAANVSKNKIMNTGRCRLFYQRISLRDGCEIDISLEVCTLSRSFYCGFEGIDRRLES